MYCPKDLLVILLCVLPSLIVLIHVYYMYPTQDLLVSCHVSKSTHTNTPYLDFVLLVTCCVFKSISQLPNANMLVILWYVHSMASLFLKNLPQTSWSFGSVSKFFSFKNLYCNLASHFKVCLSLFLNCKLVGHFVACKIGGVYIYGEALLH